MFLAFDIYDKKHGRFLSRQQRNRRLAGTGIHTTPLLACRPVSGVADLLALLETRSKFSDGFLEGVYLRIDEQRLPDGRYGMLRAHRWDVSAHGSCQRACRGQGSVCELTVATHRHSQTWPSNTNQLQWWCQGLCCSSW